METYLAPKRGAIALSETMLGLITVDEPVEIVNEEVKSLAWTGIQLINIAKEGGDEIKVGDPWSSKNPQVVAYIEDLVTLLKLMDQSIPIISINLRDVLRAIQE